MTRYPKDGRHFFDRVQRMSSFGSVLRESNWGGETVMIRIEGIPVVAARLADAQKAKSTQPIRSGFAQKTHERRRPDHIDDMATTQIILGDGPGYFC